MRDIQGHLRTRVSNKTEREFCANMRKRGFLPIPRGWPDYCLFGPDGKVLFVEVKGAKDKLRIEQYVILVLLHDLGFDVRISNGNGTGRELSDDEIDKGRRTLWSWVRRNGRALQYRLANPELNWIQDRINKEARKLIVQITVLPKKLQQKLQQELQQ